MISAIVRGLAWLSSSDEESTRIAIIGTVFGFGPVLAAMAIVASNA